MKKKIKIILINDIQNLGHIGDIKEVKPGFAINYLIPYKKAIEVSKENIKIYENKKKLLYQKQTQLINEAKLKSQQINKLKQITIYVKSNKYGKLFGSIKVKDIIQELLVQNITIKKSEIKTKLFKFNYLGIYEINFIFNKIKSKLQLNIINKPT